jgi:hypothetical protein
LVFTGLKSSISCVISQECSMALCLLAPFGEVQKDAQQPLHLGKPGKVTPTQNPPCAGLCGRFGPQVGERPVPACSGAIWAPQGPVWQKEKKPPTTPGLGKIWGCDSQAGERDGAVRRPLPGSPRPAEPVVPGFLPGPTARKIRGRLGGLGVTAGVRNTKFSGGKPFFRVSPPGSTKG